MADINQENAPASCVTFTAETEKGRAWLGQLYHETSVVYALTNDNERAEAERLKQRAIADGLTVSALESN